MVLTTEDDAIKYCGACKEGVSSMRHFVFIVPLSSVAMFQGSVRHVYRPSACGGTGTKG